jgi:rubrerythrin
MVLDELATVVVGRGERVVHECRRCGATLESPDDHCPYCGRTDVATFDLSE